MKVAILTITDGQNYGNRLQNYALQQVLLKLGCEVDTIKISTYRDRSFKKEVFFILKQVTKRALLRENTFFGQILRKRKFQQFNRLINWSSISLQNNIIPHALDEMYDFFICGSDQIWNTRIRIVNDNINNYLASFVSGEKRISYGASFGTKVLDTKVEDLFRKELSLFKALSVREKAGQEIIRVLCNRTDTQVVLDPTLMVGADEWSHIAHQPPYVSNKKYVLTYFLGGRSEKLDAYIEGVTEKIEATTIDLDIEFLSDDNIKNMKQFCTPPDEFLWLVKHAECVLTDSYHATAFSILFHKPFVVFMRKSTEKRNDMGIRINNLLSLFDLKCFRGDLEKPSIVPNSYDFVHVDAVLERERKRSETFLRNALFQ